MTIVGRTNCGHGYNFFGVAYPYMDTTRHFHVVFDVRVLDLNLNILWVVAVTTPSFVAVLENILL